MTWPGPTQTGTTLQGSGLTEGNETLPFSCGVWWGRLSCANGGCQSGGVRRDVDIREILLAFRMRTGGVQRQERELSGRASQDLRTTRTRCQEAGNNVGNNIAPELPKKDAEVSFHVHFLCAPGQCMQPQ